jgi:hypothetical protein
MLKYGKDNAIEELNKKDNKNWDRRIKGRLN